MDRSPFDDAALRAFDAFGDAAAQNTLLPSMAHEMAVFPEVRGAMFDVITNFFNSDFSAKKAAISLANEVQAVM